MPENGDQKNRLKLRLWEVMWLAKEALSTGDKNKAERYWLIGSSLAEDLTKITSPRTKEGIGARFQVISCLVEAGEIEAAKEYLRKFIVEKNKK